MSSNWVLTEVQKARKRERVEGIKILFPIRIVEYSDLASWECFDSDLGEDIAKAVRKYFIPDFSEWSDEANYKEAFKRLMDSLVNKKKKANSLKGK